ncbi:MAG: hypothetical protein IPN86_09065 [Saprospiraceae bacterium]|nr:hypothetical protein [Saprospiraceae bacterium]
MDAKNKFLPVIILMVIGAFGKLLPHIPNFTPTESIAIFGAAYLGSKYMKYIIPLVILYLSDFIINNTIARSFFVEQEGIVWFDQYMIYNFIALVFIVLVSTKLLKKINATNVFLSILSASIIFFMITNYGSWASEKSIYTNDLSGLLMSYTAGIPFFRTTLLSNLLFSTILFGSYEMIQSLVSKRAAQFG